MVDLGLQVVYLILVMYVLSLSRELGRFLICLYLGVPGSKLKFDPFKFPHRLEIFNGDKWISSNEEDFLAAYYRYEPARRGGFTLYSFPWLFESAVLFASYVVLDYSGSSELAYYIVLFSMVIAGIILLYQLFDFWRQKKYRGDFIVLYVLYPQGAVGLLIIYYLFRLSMVFFP
ncbi:MAG: hypothetical protein ACQEQG_05205 [Bacillota bacterium]